MILPKTTRRAVSFCLGTLILGCARKVAPPVVVHRVPTREISYRKQVQPIFTAHCIACHSPGAYEDGSPMGGLNLSEVRSAQYLVNTPSLQSHLMRVVPGNLEASYLYHKLNGTFLEVGGTGTIMPLASIGQLTAADHATIEDWILGGAKIDN